MSISEDTELQDLVKQTLERSGILPKIRAELRANVFLVLDQNGSFQEEKYHNEKLRNFMDSENGLIAVKIVREFLEYFDLTFTATVFDEEISRGKGYNYGGRDELLQVFPKETSSEGPIISELLLAVQDSLHSSKQSPQPANNIANDNSKWNIDVSPDCSKKSFLSPSDLFSRPTFKTDFDELFNSTNNKVESLQAASSPRLDVSDNEKPDNKTTSDVVFNKVPSQKSDVPFFKSSKQNNDSGSKLNPLSSLDDLPPLTVPTSPGDVSLTHSNKFRHVTEKLKSALIDCSSENYLNDISQASSLSDDEKKEYQSRTKNRLFNVSSNNAHLSHDEDSILSEIDEILSASSIADVASCNISENEGALKIE